MFSFSSAIGACARCFYWEQALSLFGLLPSASVSPNLVTYSATISACERVGLWALAVHLLSQAPSPDALMYDTVLSACDKGGQWEPTLWLLSEMPSSRILPQTMSYNVGIRACARAGEWQKALQIFLEMPEGLVDGFSFCAAIAACEGDRYWSFALELLARAPPNVFSYTAAISACGKAQKA